MIEFEVKSKTQPIGKRKGQTVYFAQPVSQQHLTNKMVVDRIVRETSLSAGDVSNALISLGAIVRDAFEFEERNNIWNTPYLFNAKEFDEETGLYYYGARYYDPRVSLWISTDPKATDAADWTPYRFGFNNPIRYTDPDGRWEWDAAGNLKAQKGDNSYSLAKFFGTSQKNAMTILNRGGVTSNDKGVLNLKAGQVLSKNDLWVGFKSKSGAVVNNSKEAVSHYYKGKEHPLMLAINLQ